MSLSGNIETMPLPDILQFVGLGRKTGVLTITHASTRKELVFEDGFAVCCLSNNPKEYLGQHLLARTSITEANLEKAFRRQRSCGRPLGEILVESEMLTEDEIKLVLSRKIEDSMYEVFLWSAGTFEFEESEVLDGRLVPFRLQLNWETLVMEGARRFDEMSLVRRRIPTDGVTLLTRRDNFPDGFPSSGGDKRLVDLVEKNFTARQIFTRFHASDFSIRTRLAELVSEGVFEVDEASLAEADAPDRNELLQHGSQLLIEGELAQALAVFRQGLSRFPSDSAFTEGHAAVEQRLRQGFESDEGELVPVLTRSLEDLMEAELSAEAAYLITRINGQWTVGSISMVCPFEEVEVLAILHGLRQEGVIDVALPVKAEA